MMRWAASVAVIMILAGCVQTPQADLTTDQWTTGTLEIQGKVTGVENIITTKGARYLVELDGTGKPDPCPALLMETAPELGRLVSQELVFSSKTVNHDSVVLAAGLGCPIPGIPLTFDRLTQAKNWVQSGALWTAATSPSTVTLEIVTNDGGSHNMTGASVHLYMLRGPGNASSFSDWTNYFADLFTWLTRLSITMNSGVDQDAYTSHRTRWATEIATLDPLKPMAGPLTFVDADNEGRIGDGDQVRITPDFTSDYSLLWLEVHWPDAKLGRPEGMSAMGRLLVFEGNEMLDWAKADRPGRVQFIVTRTDDGQNLHATVGRILGPAVPWSQITLESIAAESHHLSPGTTQVGGMRITFADVDGDGNLSTDDRFIVERNDSESQAVNLVHAPTRWLFATWNLDPIET